MDRQQQIADLESERQKTFILRILKLLIAFMTIWFLLVVLTLSTLFWPELTPVSEQGQAVMKWMTPSAGFLFAELARRRTVNPKTDDLRPYSWRELLLCPKY